jgi:hypothetical protein
MFDNLDYRNSDYFSKTGKDNKTLGCLTCLASSIYDIILV